MSKTGKEIKVFIEKNTENDLSTEEYVQFSKKLEYYAKLKYIYQHMDKLSKSDKNILDRVAKVYNDCPNNWDIGGKPIFKFVTSIYDDNSYFAFIYDDEDMGDFKKGIEYLKELYDYIVFKDFDDINFNLNKEWKVLIDETYNLIGRII